MGRDPAEFERSFRAHHDAVLAYALRRTSPDDARDVVAETFLVAWRRFGEAPGDAQLPWLYGVARRVLANQRRAAGRRAALVDRLGTQAAPGAAYSGTVDGDGAGETDATARGCLTPVVAGDGALAAALARLGEADREVLLLVAWEGLDTADAARALDCRPATLRMRLHRARGRLGALLDEPAGRLAPTASMEPTS